MSLDIGVQREPSPSYPCSCGRLWANRGQEETVLPRSRRKQEDERTRMILQLRSTKARSNIRKAYAVSRRGSLTRIVLSSTRTTTLFIINTVPT